VSATVPSGNRGWLARLILQAPEFAAKYPKLMLLREDLPLLHLKQGKAAAKGVNHFVLKTDNGGSVPEESALEDPDEECSSPGPPGVRTGRHSSHRFAQTCRAQARCAENIQFLDHQSRVSVHADLQGGFALYSFPQLADYVLGIHFVGYVTILAKYLTGAG